MIFPDSWPPPEVKGIEPTCDWLTLATLDTSLTWFDTRLVDTLFWTDSFLPTIANQELVFKTTPKSIRSYRFKTMYQQASCQTRSGWCPTWQAWASHKWARFLWPLEVANYLGKSSPMEVTKDRTYTNCTHSKLVMEGKSKIQRQERNPITIKHTIQTCIWTNETFQRVSTIWILNPIGPVQLG
jgi:hypothetical protein